MQNFVGLMLVAIALGGIASAIERLGGPIEQVAARCGSHP